MMALSQSLMARGYLIEPGLLNTEVASAIKEIDENLLAEAILQGNPPKFITKSYFLENLSLIINRLKGQYPNLKECELKQKIEEKTQDVLSSRKVLIVEEHNTKARKITVDDFTNYFRSRYRFFKTILQERNLEGLTSIGKIFGSRRNLAIIGLVYEKRKTKNGNWLLVLEDPTGKISVVVNKDKKELFDLAEMIVHDEVIAIKGSGSQEIVFANDIILPDSGLREIKRAEEEEYAVFTADFHIGSDKFLEENFLKFISWLNGDIGNESQKELSKKIKYLFVVGDLTDSIGVYPAQEKELSIKDVYEQYKYCAELLSKIRKDITIIVCPGNHDAVRLIEPQPKFDCELAPDLLKMENVIVTTNPSMVNIGKTKSFEGFNVLLYHGRSIDYYMDQVDALRMANAKLNPESILKFLLKKRHLAPTHACTTILPEADDFLAIKTIPDIVVSAHIHRSGIVNYNGILAISCSCFQAKTAYQEKLGHEPDPGKICLFNLKTRKINVIDFS